jgi:hypothetical protein
MKWFRFKLTPISLLAALIFLPFAAFAQRGPNLTEKYESAKTQITKLSISAYNNALSNLMAQAKQKADLDSYLAIQTEQKRVLDGGVVDDGTTNSIASVASISKKIVVERDNRIAVQLRQYVSQLESLLKQSMLSDKIDEAKVVKEILDKAKAELAGLKPKLPIEQTGKATPTPPLQDKTLPAENKEEVSLEKQVQDLPVKKDFRDQNKIVPGEGWKGVRIGATQEELIKELGKPDNTLEKPNNDNNYIWLRWIKRKSIHCLVDEQRGAFEIRFDQGFNGETVEGIRIGSTLKKAIAAYGEPSDIVERNGGKKLEWASKGILIWFCNDKAMQIVVINSY